MKRFLFCDGNSIPARLHSWRTGAHYHLEGIDAVGADKVPIEVLQAMGEVVAAILHFIWGLIWKNEKWPSE